LLYKNTKIKIYRTIILSVVLYGCETWPVTLKEEHRLRVIENKVLRKIFGPKRVEVTEKWRRLHNEELYALYFSPNIIQVIRSIIMRWAVHMARMGDRRGAYRVLMGRRDGKNHLEDIEVDGRIILKWIFKKWNGGMDWIALAQDRDRWRALVNAVMNFRVTQYGGNSLSS
jgi:hypothetical protein